MADVTLSGRTLYRDGDWNTLCLPFDVSTLTGTPLEGATLMELGNSGACNTGFDASTGTLTLDFVSASSIEAGHAYIVKWTTTGAPIVNPVFTRVTVENESPDDQKVVNSFRAYFQLNKGLTAGEPSNPNSVRGFSLGFGEGDATRISASLVKSEEVKSEKWYSLDGRRLDGKPVRKGLYIYNGKKRVIK